MTISSIDIKITFSSLVYKKKERERERVRETKRHNAYVLTITLRDYYLDNHFNYTDSTLETSSKRTLLFRHSRFSSTEWADGGLSDVSPFSSLLHALSFLSTARFIFGAKRFLGCSFMKSKNSRESNEAGIGESMQDTHDQTRRRHAKPNPTQRRHSYF